jgi:hypothetical protein
MERETKYVPWAVFIWAIGIFATVIGFMYIQMTDINTDSQGIQTQLSQIQTDIQWIKLTLGDHAK